MSHWQFCEGGSDITADPYAGQFADEIRLWDVSGELIIAATKYFHDGETYWCVSASDYYHGWANFADSKHDGAESAIVAMFSSIEHEHQASETAEFYEKNGITFGACDLCGKSFQPFKED